MRMLILVKHSLPEIVREAPASRWRLSAEGRARCAPLARALAPYGPDRFVASAQPKARETAEIVAGLLDKPISTAEGLHEHDRDNVPYFETTGEFEAAVAALFAAPDTLVFGRETADEARARFTAAVEATLARYPRDNVAIVAHGTVIALFVAACADIAPDLLWRRLGLPSFVVLSLPERSLLTTVAHVGATE